MNQPARDESDRIRRYFRKASWSAWPTGRAYLGTERGLLLVKVASMSDRPIGALWICDVGCGSGQDLAHWVDVGVDEAGLAGTELAVERARAASERLPKADIRLVDGFALPFADDAFDLATASLVFSTITDASLRRMLFEHMWRVTRPGGLIAIYDFRVKQPRNRNVVAMTPARIRDLGGGHPLVKWSAAPFLPALPVALRLRGRMQTLAIRLLPRTHAMWVWRKAAR